MQSAPFVPARTELAPTSHMRNGPDHASVQEHLVLRVETIAVENEAEAPIARDDTRVVAVQREPLGGNVLVRRRPCVLSHHAAVTSTTPVAVGELV